MSFLSARFHSIKNPTRFLLVNSSDRPFLSMFGNKMLEVLGGTEERILRGEKRINLIGAQGASREGGSGKGMRHRGRGERMGK